MRRTVFVALFVTVGIQMVSDVLFAHHSAAGLFSPDVETTISGTVKQWLFVNPHPAIVMDVKNNQGAVETWRIQFPAPAGLSQRFGWDRNSIKPGDQIKIHGNPYSNNYKVMFPLVVTLANGKEYKVREPRQAPD